MTADALQTQEGGDHYKSMATMCYVSPETNLVRSGFQRGYAHCNGRWVKCWVPPNSKDKTRIPHRIVNGIKVTLGKEEYDRLPFEFTCND